MSAVRTGPRVLPPAPSRSGGGAGNASAPAPALVAVAHGTRDPRGAGTVRALLDRVRALRPELTVIESYVEITAPALGAVLPALPGRAVVVPLLLGTGYHVTVDLPGVVAGSGAEVVLAPALGPHPLLVTALHRRLVEAGWGGEPVVLAAAGSSHRQPCVDAERTAALLARRLRVPVRAAYAASVRPTVAAAVADAAAAAGGRAAVSSYLLAPGHFHDRVARVAAAVTSAPLGAHDAVARLVLRRYLTGCARFARAGDRGATPPSHLRRAGR